MPKISIGDRVRTKEGVRTLGGWQGTGMVVGMEDGIVMIKRDPARRRAGKYKYILGEDDDVMLCIEEVESLA